MAEVDRLGWAAGIGCESFGVRFGVRVDDADALGIVRTRLPPGHKAVRTPVVDRLFSYRAGGSLRRGTRRFSQLYDGSMRIARALDPAEALEALEREAGLHVAAESPDHVFVHAGVVEWRGRAIVMPGASGAGKSRLVEALLRLGARYGSDEFAVFDAAGRVQPYPRRLALRRPGGGAERVDAAELGARLARRALEPALFLFATFVPGARFAPRPLPPGRALLRLLASTPPIRRRPRRVLSTLHRALKGARSFAGRRGEAEAAADLLVRLAEAGLEGSS